MSNHKKGKKKKWSKNIPENGKEKGPLSKKENDVSLKEDPVQDEVSDLQDLMTEVCGMKYKEIKNSLKVRGLFHN